MNDKKGQAEKTKKGKMVKKLLFGLLLLLPGAVAAQDLDISLFDDVPNLGYDAEPLDSLRITPPPAPDIRINLDNSVPASQGTEPVSSEPSSTPPLPSIAIDLPGTIPSSTLVEADAAPSTGPARPPKDVSGFDVSDFELGEMSRSVFQKAKKLGFKVLGTQESIPLYYATEYEHRCRKEGVRIPDAVSKCIQDYACHEKTRYIAEATLQRKNEYLTLYFTTNDNDNVLYKIVYINKGDHSLNFTRINKFKKQQRQVDFWNAVFDKYGYPDDEKKYIWGDPTKAYMKAFVAGSAYDAYIILEDVRLSNEDYFMAVDAESDRPPRSGFDF